MSAYRETTSLIKAHLPDAIARLAESYIIDSEGGFRTAAAGHWELTEQLPRGRLNPALRGACADGSIEMAAMLIDRGADMYKNAYMCALARGHTNMADYLYKYAVDCWHLDHVALASCSGQMHVIQWAEARVCDECPKTNYNNVLMSGCKTGDISIMTYAIAHGVTSWGHGLYGASVGGHRGIMLIMLYLGAHPNHGLYGACKSGDKRLAQEMIGRGASDFNAGLDWAAKGGQIGMMKMMVERGAIALNHALSTTCTRGIALATEWLIAHGATRCKCNRSMNVHLMTAARMTPRSARVDDA